MIWLKLWFMSLCLVGVRAFQQKNVMGDHYARIVPTSYAFALCDMAVVYSGLQTWVSDPLFTVLSIGTGAWMGCWASLYIHKKLDIHKKLGAR